MTQDSSAGYVSVHVCWTDAEAGVLTSLLRAHGIHAITSSEPLREIYGFTVDGLGQIEVLVPANDRAEAQRLIAEKGEDLPISEDCPNPSPAPEEG